MIVNRHEDPNGPATLSIYRQKDTSEEGWAEAAADTRKHVTMSSSWLNMAKAPDPLPQERVTTIDMRYRMGEEILELLLAETNAKVVIPTQEETEFLRKLAEEEKQLAYVNSESERLKKLHEEESGDMAKARAMALGTR